ncbi:hypothetical protein CI610_01553 [invertebrate metagenome]|uniref:RING-type domain-containing protein n=1 Tax=invertebrate metagenome TaxID=1711999 RepID=A0A2H9T8F9_9ZZZZ
MYSPKNSPPFKIITLEQLKKSINASEFFPQDASFFTVHIDSVRYLHCGSDLKFIAYSNLSDRINSFTNWFGPETPSVKDIARAGFYYTGNSDICCCFTCGTQCNQWKPDANPWKEHILSFPTCNFLRKNQPLEYINLVHENYLLAQQFICCECKNNPKDIVFYPCGHLVCCKDCGKNLTTCPACNTAITEKFYAHFD